MGLYSFDVSTFTSYLAGRQVLCVIETTKRKWQIAISEISQRF